VLMCGVQKNHHAFVTLAQHGGMQSASLVLWLLYR